ncbi:hypothetical protein [Escherichia coli]|uniref:hypothetical protein n=1 Tax=Escherichia coli TaxID=562 RepID=UPI000E68CEF8|nr:hypothetical protein [Escherichia coli]RIW25585.1 hypothetical protein D3C97_23060 [Escherichia coli]
MLNKMSKVVCKSFWSRCFSINPLLLTICGFSLILICSILPAPGKAAEKGEIIFKSRIQRADCTVSAPASITLDDITMGYQDNNVSSLYMDNKEFELSIDCNNPVNVTSYITIGTQGEMRSGNFAVYMQGVAGVNRKIELSLEYLEDDRVNQGIQYLGDVFAVFMSNDGVAVNGKQYCTGDTDRKCRFRPLIHIPAPRDWGNGSTPEDTDFGDFSQSITFYLNYV